MAYTFDPPTEPKDDRSTAVFKPGDGRVRARDLLLSGGAHGAVDTFHFAQGDEEYNQQITNIVGNEEARIPEPGAIRDNLKVLAWALERLRQQEPGAIFTVTSGLRTPDNNRAAGGAFASRHQAGLAADVIMTREGSQISPSEVADTAREMGGAPGFDKAIIYPPGFDNFTHLALARSEPADYSAPTTLFRKTPAGTVRIDTHGGASSSGGRQEYGSDHDDEEVQLTRIGTKEYAQEQGDLLNQMGVRQAKNTDWLDQDDEQAPLPGRDAPTEGELDIGDLRFGSVKFDEKDPSDLNQPTSIGQQSSGAVATSQLLRTEMNPVLADNKGLPETVVTLSLNATDRDDVNRRLRPLIAMHKRMPFCAARNRDLARMMLGLSVSEDLETRLAEIYPNASEEQRPQLMEGMPEDLASFWVPVTMRHISVDTQPGAAGVFQVHVVLRFANIQPYAPTMQFWETTDDAVEWARYLSLRSTQSSEVFIPGAAAPSAEASSETDPGTATVVTPTDRAITAAPPQGMGEKQVDSPYKSYVFRKMYRGMLEEFQPERSGGFYDGYRANNDYDQIRPLAGHGDDEIYEPGYPLQDPERSFEEYDSSTPIGLQFLTVSGEQTPQARLQSVVSSFEEQVNLADRLDAAVQIADLGHEEIRGLEEAGKISPIIVGPGRRMGKIMLSVSKTADAFRKVSSELDAMSGAGSIESQLKNSFTGFSFDLDRGTLQEEEYETSAASASQERADQLTTTYALVDDQLQDTNIAQGAMQPADVFSQGGIVDFNVPDRKHEEVSIPFTDRVENLQKGILASFVNLMGEMGRASYWTGYSMEETGGDWSPWFDQFVGRQIQTYIEDSQSLSEEDWDFTTKNVAPSWSTMNKMPSRQNVPVPEAGKTGENGTTVSGFSEVLPEGFDSYMLTFRFIQAMLDRTRHWKELSSLLGLTSTDEGYRFTAEPSEDETVFDDRGRLIQVRERTALIRIGEAKDAGRIPEPGEKVASPVLPSEEVEGVTDIKVPIEPLVARKKLEDLLGAAQSLSQLTNQAVRGGKGAITQHYQEAAQETYGYLALQNATVENVHLRFTNRFGDREWEGYPQSVTQHIGGGNAEVTIEMVTNNKLLLDQLGELKRSQQTLSEKRKSEDVVPPLMQVMGPGNLLRAHGIRNLAYRDHTVNMAQDEPGYYKIRLDLVQDEKTLIRAETFRPVGGTRDQQITSTRSTAPLTIPAVFDEDRPAGVYDLLRKVYPDDLPEQEPERPDFLHEREAEDPKTGVYLNEQYLLRERESSGARLSEVINERQVIATDVTYRPPEQRGWALRAGEIRTPVPEGRAPALEADFIWRDAEEDEHRTRGADVTDFFRPLVSFLDRAQSELEEKNYRRLVQRAMGALETTGRRNGLLLSYIRLANARTQEHFLYDGPTSAGINGPAKPTVEELRAAQETEETERIEEFYQLNADPQRLNIHAREVESRPREIAVADNMTDMIRRVATGEELRSPFGNSLARLQTNSYRLAASELTSVLFNNAETYAFYREWLQSRGQSTPGIDEGDVLQASQSAHSLIIDQQRKLPSAYMDLLLPELQDPAQDGTNILAPDFPFGPGEAQLHEDQHLHNYEVADSMRQAAAMKMATIGFETLTEYMPEGGDDDKNVDRLERAVQQTVGDISSEMSESLSDRAPIQLSDDASALDQMVQDMEQNAAFTGELGQGVGNKRLGRDDLVQALQISKTIEYTTQVMEVAAENAGAALIDGETLNEDLFKGKGTPEGGDTSPFGRVIKALKEGRSPIIGSSGSAGDANKALENSTRVSGNSWLKRKREELVRLYEADEQVISEHLGYYDKHTEPRRAKLRKKLGDSWTDWKGMRQAFPSYMVVVAGKMGTGLGDVMSDLYSWTAVQQLEIRDLSDQAGQYATLRLSNMRKRIAGNGQGGGADLIGRNAYDPQMDVGPGSHMHVYTGYGPDPVHMNMFAGRVTGMQPGPVTEMELSSYSTTLSNPPAEGRGFFVDGWSGQQSIAESVLYTISQTSGLEGLGRNALGSAIDRLGREARGFADEDYRSSVVTSLYRTFGSPGLSWMFEGEQERRAGSLLDMVSRYGTDNVKDLILGDPAIYENIWLSSGRESSGAADMIFGGLADYLSGGKGWGWAALPGETAWAQLKDQAKLFPDYVVTTRGYNEHVPLTDQDEHPPRQTLYFGPKSGNYISSSQEPGESEAFLNYTEEDIDRAIAEARRQDTGANTSESTGDVRQSYLFEEYQDLVIDQTLLPIIVRTLTGGEGGDISDQLAESLSDTFATIAGGTPATGFGEFGELVGFLNSRSLAGDRRSRVDNVVRRLFPSVHNAISSSLTLRIFEETGTIREPLDQGQDVAGSVYLATFSMGERGPTPASAASDPRVDWPATARRLGIDSESGSPKEKAIARFMKAFRKDLIALAKEPGAFANLTNNSIEDNPLVQRIRGRLLDQGLIPNQRMDPVQKHHFGNMYDTVAMNNTRATDRHQDFANRVTLTFPTEPDDRLAAYFGQQGEQNSYQVQVSPTISEDYIVDRQVYYPNLRFNQTEAAGMIASQLSQAADGKNEPSFSDLTAARSNVREAMADGKQDWTFDVSYNWDNIDSSEVPERIRENEQTTPEEALGWISKLIQERLDRMAPYYSRPKYSTVAVNMLKDSFRNMYDGEITMAGNPSIKPYHMLHLWDDVDEMQGPVEVDGVYHRFGAQDGFYTQVKPKLATYMRHADDGMDTHWMSQAAKVTHTMNWATRAASASGKLMGFGARAGMYTWLSSAAASGALSANSMGLKGLAKGLAAFGTPSASGAATLLGPAGWAVIVADAAYTIGEYAYETGQEKAQQYVGMINGAMDSNPITFLPLSYKGEPYTAGLTGSEGPASLTRVATDQIDEKGNLSGMKTREIFDRLQSTYSTGAQAPQ
jgi:hypothetical protein